MAVNDSNGLVVSHADMVRLDAHNFPQSLMHLVDDAISASSPTCRQQPKVGELGWERRGDVAKMSKG